MNKIIPILALSLALFANNPQSENVKINTVSEPYKKLCEIDGKLINFDFSTKEFTRSIYTSHIKYLGYGRVYSLVGNKNSLAKEKRYFWGKL